jgi:hypothetical protein
MIHRASIKSVLTLTSEAFLSSIRLRQHFELLPKVRIIKRCWNYGTQCKLHADHFLNGRVWLCSDFKSTPLYSAGFGPVAGEHAKCATTVQFYFEIIMTGRWCWNEVLFTPTETYALCPPNKSATIASTPGTAETVCRKPLLVEFWL